MHINDFHLTHFHSCVPVLISKVWIMVQFYMSCAGEMFFSLLAFCALDQLQNVFQLQRQSFNLKAWNEYLRDLFIVNIYFNPFSQTNQPTHPKLPPATWTSTTERFIIISLQSVRTWRVKEASQRWMTFTVNWQFSSTPDPKMMIHVLEEECPGAQRLVENKTRIYNTTRTPLSIANTTK